MHLTLKTSDVIQAVDALRHCAKEHLNDTVPTFAIHVTRLCEDVANLLTDIRWHNVEDEEVTLCLSENCLVTVECVTHTESGKTSHFETKCAEYCGYGTWIDLESRLVLDRVISWMKLPSPSE